MITLDCVQGTEEWVAARCGIPTASNFDKIITTKGEPSKQAEKYMHKLAGERITGFCEEGYKSTAMQRGNDVEAEARYFYELITDRTIKQVGVCYANEDKKYSSSPDGLVGDDGGLELKCPSMSTHVSYLLEGKLPSEYFQQVQGNLMITSRKWWDFVSYYPGMKPLIVRVERNEKFIASLQAALETFCNDLEKIVEKIK